MASVSEIQDLLRSKLGVPDIDPFVLKYILAQGRRELETRGNYYYMVGGPKDHTLTISTQSYSLTSSSGTGLGITNYKDKRSLFIKDVAGTQYIQLPIGSWVSSIEEMPTTSAKPQAAVIENDTIYFLPTPDAAYPVRLLYFNWTTNPADITSTDELFTRWPDAILYASIMAGKRFLTQGKDQASEWEGMMKDQISLLKKFTKSRIGEPDDGISTSEAATILQAAGAPQQ